MPVSNDESSGIAASVDVGVVSLLLQAINSDPVPASPVAAKKTSNERREERILDFIASQWVATKATYVSQNSAIQLIQANPEAS
jgi:hypothetical protein